MSKRVATKAVMQVREVREYKMESVSMEFRHVAMLDMVYRTIQGYVEE